MASDLGPSLRCHGSYLTFDDPKHISLDDCEPLGAFLLILYLFTPFFQGSSTRSVIPSRHLQRSLATPLVLTWSPPRLTNPRVGMVQPLAPIHICPCLLMLS